MTETSTLETCEKSATRAETQLNSRSIDSYNEWSGTWQHIYPAILLIVTAAIYMLPAGRAILDDGNALYAHIAQQMVQRGDWVTPYANGVRFLDKPPLMFWLTAASYRLFGFNEWAARLPTFLGVFGTAWLLWRIGVTAAGQLAGFFAGLMFILSAGTLFFTLNAFPDIFLVFFLTLALYSFARWYLDRRDNGWYVLGFSIALAGAVLSKSLIGIVFPIAAVALFLLFAREWPRIRPRHLIAGVVAFLAIAVPWHLLAAIRNPGFFSHYFINEQLLRFVGRRYPVDYGTLPVPIFWALLVVLFLPWTAFLPLTLRPGRILGGRNDPSAVVVRLAWCWAGVIIAFFTLSSRLEHYWFPALPPLALAAAVALSPSVNEPRSKAVRRAFASLAGLGLLAGVSAIALLVWWKTGGSEILAGPAIWSHDRAYTNLFSPLFDMTPAERGHLGAPFVGALVVFALGTLLGWWLNRNGRRLAAVLSLASMMIVFSLLTLYSLHLCEGLISSKVFGVALQQIARPGEKVVVVGDFESANSINFYAPVQIVLYDGAAASLEQGLRYSDAPRMILSRADLDGLWQGGERAFLLVRRTRLAELGLNPSYSILDDGGRTLISNVP